MMTSSFGLAPLLHAAAAHIGAPVTGDLRWLHLGPDELARLTDADRELAHVVTGERLPFETDEDGVLVSFFVLQIALDRAVGALPQGQDVSIAYVEYVYEQYERTCPEGNPFSDDLFDLALAFLVGRELSRLDPVA